MQAAVILILNQFGDGLASELLSDHPLLGLLGPSRDDMDSVSDTRSDLVDESQVDLQL